MKLSTLIKELDTIRVVNGEDPDITDITYDSRRVQKNSLFVAVSGFTRDGNDFIPQALDQGAAAVISENLPQNDSPVWVQVKDARTAMAVAGKKLWKVDFSGMFTAAVTGTNGKTTCATVLAQICNALFGEENSWCTGTLGNRYGDRHVDLGRTTPEAVDLFRDIGSSPTPPRALVMEVSSHALSLQRVKGFSFNVAIFTNLSQDHLDFHSDMEDYYAAKKELFTAHLKSQGIALINCDDPYGKRLARELDGKRVVTYGRSSQADMRIETPHTSPEGVFFRLRYGTALCKIHSPLVGDFNILNLAAVAGASLVSGFDMKVVQRVLKTITPVPGRMDRVDISAPFPVIVDYAHTPDALVNILTTVRKLASGQLIAVFGAGGDRDRSKRPEMAKAVAQNADYAVITSDNPRSENPEIILNDIEAGFPSDFPRRTIGDRRAAIRAALARASDDDAVVIAGKGHETYQEIKGVKHHFDDR
ncbi:MAG: UDP-N-acetylmuramoyl-L-alanyl-D-glutamate--2,6-diaminopimelate ligase, partial [Fibrobacterota bacterium]